MSVGMSLVINIGFWFERIPSVYAGSGRVKSTKSSSKSSSTEGRAGRIQLCLANMAARTILAHGSPSQDNGTIQAPP